MQAIFVHHHWRSQGGATVELAGDFHFQILAKTYDLLLFHGFPLLLPHPSSVVSIGKRMATFFVMTYGLGFAALSATVVHVFLFHGSEILKRTREAFRQKKRSGCAQQVRISSGTFLAR